MIESVQVNLWMGTGKPMRFMRIWNPPEATATNRVPLVMLFHGGGSDPFAVEWESKFLQVAEKERFAVASIGGFNKDYPRFQRYLFWNDGRPLYNGDKYTVDDVAVVREALQNIYTRTYVDNKRMFVMGYSNGGHFVHRLMHEMTNTFKGYGVLCATRGPDEFFGLPSKPISFIQFAGALDPFCPFNGGVPPYETKFKTNLKPVMTAWNEWTVFNQAGLVKVSNLGLQTTVGEYVGPNAKMKLYVGSKMGHVWPGGNVEQHLGPANNDFLASQEAWNFFKGL